MQFWGLGKHEFLIPALFIPVVFCRNCRGHFMIKGNYWSSVTSIAIDLGRKREWELPGPVHMEGKLRQVSE